MKNFQMVESQVTPGHWWVDVSLNGEDWKSVALFVGSGAEMNATEYLMYRRGSENKIRRQS